MSGGSAWGLWLEPVLPVRDLVRLAQLAEAEGASHVFVADEGTDRDLFVALTAIAVATERVRVAAGITNPFSRHPVATAAAFATLEELAPGRVVTGFGVGGSRVLGPLDLSPPRPYSALRETVDVVGRLLAGETVTHDGVFRARDARLPWSPGPLPLAMAGRGPRVEELIVTHADWIVLSGKPHAELATLAASIRERAAAAGRGIALAWSAYLAWTDEMVEQIRPHFTYATVDMPDATRRALGIDPGVTSLVRDLMLTEGIEAAGRLVPRAVVERAAMVGTQADVVASLDRVRRAAQPELFLLPIADYERPDAFVRSAVRLLVEAGFGRERSTVHPQPTSQQEAVVVTAPTEGG